MVSPLAPRDSRPKPSSQSTQTLRALTRELATLTNSPPEGVRVQITNEADLLGNGGVVGIVQGPAGTPYEGGYFRIRFEFGEGDFPNTPPKCESAWSCAVWTCGRVRGSSR
jgi:ubiquitin-protein ligase